MESSSNAPAENAESSSVPSSAPPPVAPGFDVLLNAALMHESPSGTKRPRSEKSSSANGTDPTAGAASSSSGHKLAQNAAVNIQPAEQRTGTGSSSSSYSPAENSPGSAFTRRILDVDNNDSKNSALAHRQECGATQQDSANAARALQQQQIDHRELLMRHHHHQAEAEHAEKARVDEYLNNGQYMNRAQAPPPLQITLHEALLRAGSLGLSSSSIFSSSRTSFDAIMNHGRTYGGAGRSGEPYSIPYPPNDPGHAMQRLVPHGAPGHANGMSEVSGAPFSVQQRALLEQLQLQQERQRHQQEHHQRQEQHRQQQQQQQQQFLAAAAAAAAAGQHRGGHPLFQGPYSASAAYAHLLAQSQQQAHQLAHVRSLQGAPPGHVGGAPGALPHHFSPEASFLQYMAQQQLQPRGGPVPTPSSNGAGSGGGYPGHPYGMTMHYQPHHPPFGYPSGAQFLRGHLCGLHPPARGSTCGACARSKVKCDRIQPCARCTRLGLECVPRQKVRGTKSAAAAAAADPSDSSEPPPPSSSASDQATGMQEQSAPADDNAATGATADNSACDATATDNSAATGASTADGTAGDTSEASNTAGDVGGSDIPVTNGPVACAGSGSAPDGSAQSETSRPHAVTSDDQLTSTESLVTLGSIQALSSQELAYLDYHQQMDLQKQIQIQESQRNTKQSQQEASEVGKQQSFQQTEQVPPPTVPAQELVKQQQHEHSDPPPFLVSATSSTEACVEQSASSIQPIAPDAP